MKTLSLILVVLASVSIGTNACARPYRDDVEHLVLGKSIIRDLEARNFAGIERRYCSPANWRRQYAEVGKIAGHMPAGVRSIIYTDPTTQAFESRGGRSFQVVKTRLTVSFPSARYPAVGYFNFQIVIERQVEERRFFESVKPVSTDGYCIRSIHAWYRGAGQVQADKSVG